MRPLTEGFVVALLLCKHVAQLQQENAFPKTFLSIGHEHVGRKRRENLPTEGLANRRDFLFFVVDNKSRRQLSCLPTTVKTTDGHADGPLNLPPIDIIIPFLLIYFLASHPRLLSPHSGIT
jgi:hypothetical protein